MNERTPIPTVYEETLERIAVDIASREPNPIHHFGIETHNERINRTYHRAEQCGCSTCKARFWRAVEDAVESEMRHSEDEVVAAIERYAPLIDEMAGCEDDELEDDDDWMDDTGDV